MISHTSLHQTWSEEASQMLSTIGCRPFDYKLRHGATIVLAHGTIHAFKKLPSVDHHEMEQTEQLPAGFVSELDTCFVGAPPIMVGGQCHTSACKVNRMSQGSMASNTFGARLSFRPESNAWSRRYISQAIMGQHSMEVAATQAFVELGLMVLVVGVPAQGAIPASKDDMVLIHMLDVMAPLAKQIILSVDDMIGSQPVYQHALPKALQCTRCQHLGLCFTFQFGGVDHNCIGCAQAKMSQGRQPDSMECALDWTVLRVWAENRVAKSMLPSVH